MEVQETDRRHSHWVQPGPETDPSLSHGGVFPVLLHWLHWPAVLRGDWRDSERLTYNLPQICLFDGERPITSGGWKIKWLKELIPGILAVDLNNILVKMVQLKKKKTVFLCGETSRALFSYSRGNWLLEHSKYCIEKLFWLDQIKLEDRSEWWESGGGGQVVRVDRQGPPVTPRW